MNKFVIFALVTMLTSSAYAINGCEPICNSPESCYEASSWVADGEVYNVEKYWDNKKEVEVTAFDFAIESWVKGEMRHGHYQHYHANNNSCLNVAELAEGKSGFFRIYGTDNRGEFIFLERIEQ